MGVGFEFATGWDIYQLKPGVNVPAQGFRTEADLKQYTTGFPKAAVVKGGFGWQMTVDGTEIEYVVDAVDESQAGENQLVGIMGDLNKFVTMMNQRNSQSFLTAADFPAGTFKAPKDRFVIFIKSDLRFKDIDAIPQVTGGVRLGRIRKLWRLLSDPNSEAAKQFFSEKPGGTPIYSPLVKRVLIDWQQIQDSRWPAHKPSAALRGLVTLIATYLQRGYSPNQDGVGAVKYLFFIMSRTSFSGLFKELPMEEQNHYKSAKDDWVNFLCVDVMSKLPGMPGTGVDPKGKVLERRITDRGNLKNSVELPIVREDWLKGMLDGRDLLSAAEHPLGGLDNATWEDSNAELGHRLRGLAGLGEKMDPLHYAGKPNKAAILEFRARQAALEYKHWPDYAFRMHKFFTEINEGDRHGVIDLDASGL
ncbi:MAG: hypothetical protein KIT83_11195 [Bryobacterales bacterium]|nr:hypothetical protein [Bryobacterales bacterium]